MTALNRIRIRYIPSEKLIYQVFMTRYAVTLQNTAVLLLYHDRFMKILECKTHGVVVSVFGFGNVFRDEIVREMTVDTGGHGMVAGFLPGIILRCHDVAVHAGRRIGTEIGEAFGIPKGKCPGADQGAEENGQHRCLAVQHPLSPSRIKNCKDR
jgi:hypothetical protein